MFFQVYIIRIYNINEMANTQTTKAFTEQEWNNRKRTARQEMGYVDIRPYSHNILGLRMADMNAEQMKRFATELELGKLGWGHLDTHGEITETDKFENRIAFELRRKRLEILHDKPSDESESESDESESDESENEIEPSDLLALKEITKLYGKDRVKDLLTEMENESE